MLLSEVYGDRIELTLREAARLVLEAGGEITTASTASCGWLYPS